MDEWRGEVSRIAGIVPGGPMTEQHAVAIGALWVNFSPRRILEIGGRDGVGTCYLAGMASSYGGYVWTVDMPWTAEPNEHFTLFTEHWLRQCGLNNVTVARRSDGGEGLLREHFEAREKLFDFVWINGRNSWQSLAAQYAMAHAAVRHGGWLCFSNLWDEDHPDVDLVWSQVVMPLHGNTYENAKMGFAMVRR